MLTERQILILKSIVILFTKYGHPVGSKTLLDETDIDASSATVRNEMVRLEEMGYLQKTHSSSGRVPSKKGYRFYVDYLLHPTTVDHDKVETIQKAFDNPFFQIDEIVVKSAEVLSNLTSYTAISLGPEIKESKLTGFRLVPLNERRVMAILVTDKGHIEEQIFTVPKGFDLNNLEKIVALFNDQLIGHSLVEVFKMLQEDVPLLIHKYMRTAEGMMELINGLFVKAVRERMHIGGKMNMLDYSDNMDIHQFKSIYSFMEGNQDLASLLGQQKQDIEVRIGNELNIEFLANFSLISATYDVEELGTGTIAILGPTNMPYSKMIGLMDVFRNELSKKIIDHHHSMDDY
ncbi:heat-inducible transcriptional repressor HrcA [Desemzia incerta]|uniref:heat-inducible transcriptional repressor HrcA n=1 Tax=Desemzia incerta TaxID=82801 RepID=UPI001660E0B7|nr:heat-inducible transcriptional repressor HrcA [Desemzia incerta]